MQHINFASQNENTYFMSFDRFRGNVELKSVEFSQKICFSDIKSIDIYANSYQLFSFDEYSLQTFCSINDNKLNFGDLCERSVDVSTLPQKLGEKVVDFCNGILNNYSHLYLSNCVELIVSIAMNNDVNKPEQLHFNNGVETCFHACLFVPVKQFETLKLTNIDLYDISQANNVHILTNDKPQYVTFTTKNRNIHFNSEQLESRVVSHESKSGDYEYVYSFGQMNFYDENVNITSDVTDCTLVIQTTRNVLYHNGLVTI